MEGSEIGEKIGETLIDSILEGKIIAVRDFLWTPITSFLVDWFFVIVPGLFLIFITLSIYSKLTGKWGDLGSFLYHVFYLWLVWVLGLIFGPEFLITNTFTIIGLVVLYPVSYFTTGLILDKLNFI